MADDQPRVQTVRNAWINRVREEALRMRRPEISKSFHVGFVIATYADADGSNAYPSGATIAAITGCSEETVTRCVRLLTAVGLMSRKRRPNQSAMYQLLLPVGQVDWATHLYVYGETRQARARRAAKAKEIADRNPSGDAVRNPSPAGIPEPVPGGGTDQPGTRPRTGAEPVPGRGPDTVPGGGYQYTPTSGRDPYPDHDMAGHSPQPQTPAGAHGETDSSAEHDDQEHPAAPELRSVPIPVGSRARRDAAAQQPPLLMSVQTEHADLRAAAEADPGLVRRAVREWGSGEAIRVYGVRLVNQHAADLLRTGT